MENADLRLDIANTLADTRFREPPTQSTVGSILDGDNEAVIMGLLRTIYLANSGYGGHLISRSREQTAAQELVFRLVRRLGRLSYTPTVPNVPLQPPAGQSPTILRSSVFPQLPLAGADV